MKGSRLIAGVVLLATVVGMPCTPPDKLVFQTAGFAIAALEAKEGKTPLQALQMYLPPSDGFAPNVNVQIQPWAQDLDAYLEVSKKGFEQARFEVVKTSKPSESVLVVEYQETRQGGLRFYARAALRNGTIYLATAAASPRQWEEVGSNLRECVDSLETLDATPANPGKKTPGR
jgi:hypothetical protein